MKLVPAVYIIKLIYFLKIDANLAITQCPKWAIIDIIIPTVNKIKPTQLFRMNAFLEEKPEMNFSKGVL